MSHLSEGYSNVEKFSVKVMRALTNQSPVLNNDNIQSAADEIVLDTSAGALIYNSKYTVYVIYNSKYLVTSPQFCFVYNNYKFC